MFNLDDVPQISQFHIDQCEEQGCDSLDEYCNINGLNYADILDDDSSNNDF